MTHSAWKINISSFAHNIASYVSEILVLLVVNYRYSAFSSITLFPSHHFARYRQAKNYTFRFSFLKSLRCDFWLFFFFFFFFWPRCRTCAILVPKQELNPCTL